MGELKPSEVKKSFMRVKIKITFLRTLKNEEQRKVEGNDQFRAGGKV